MTKILESVNGLVWGIPTLILILGVGLYLSFRTGFSQLTLFPASLRQFFIPKRSCDASQGSVSSFQALCTALAATVGTGNIAGVAGAIAIGGPGSVFWMWLCGMLGMMTKFAEATLSIRFRQKDGNGEYVGGPMFMIQNGLGSHWHWLAKLYVFFGVVAAFGVGNATQINAVIVGINEALCAFQIPQSYIRDLLIGGFLSVLIVVMLFGGAKRIGKTAEFLVPFVSAGYLLLGFGVLAANYQRIPGAFCAIVQGAFSPRAVTGGAIGSGFSALRIGVSRGVFTNEAGMGTAGIAHGGADVSHPVQQGLMGIVEVFLDTILICTMTALVILCSGVQIPYGLDEGAALTTRAFASVYGSWISVVMAAALCCFAFATVLGWGLYGVRCAQYLFGARAWKGFVLIQGGVVIVSVLLNTGTIWLLSETVNGLMAIPNLIALTLLSPELIRLTRDYKSGRLSANGGTNESIHQCKPLRTFSHEKVPSPGGGSPESGKDHLSSEYRPAGPGNTPGLL